MWRTNLKNVNKRPKKLLFWGCERLKSRDPSPQKAHLGHLLNVHTQFSIWRVVGKEHHFFKIKKEGNLHIFPPNWLGGGGWFFDMLHNFWFSINWLKKGQSFRFSPISTPSPKLGHDWILTQVHPHSYISNPVQNWADWLNWSGFCRYQAE